MLNLLKKEILITKKIFILVVAITFFIPLLIAFAGGDESLPAGILLSAYTPLLALILLTNIYEEESRFPKAAAFMVAIGYQRRTQIMVRYLLALIVFIVCLLVYWGETFFVGNLYAPILIDIIASFFVFSCFISLFLFATTKFGLTAGKYILFAVILTISLGPTFVAKLPIHIDWTFLLKLSQTQWSILLSILSVLIITVSLTAAVKIYEKKEL